MDKYTNDSIYQDEEFEDERIDENGVNGVNEEEIEDDIEDYIEKNIEKENMEKTKKNKKSQKPDNQGEKIDSKSEKTDSQGRNTEKLSSESQKELNKWNEKHKADEKNRWNEKHRPEEKLKKWIGYTTLGGLIILVIYGFIRVSFPKEKKDENQSEQEQKQDTSLPKNIMRSGSNMLDLAVNSYKDYSDAKASKEASSIPHERDYSSDKNDDIGERYEANTKNSENDLIKELIIQEIKDEMTARHSNLTFDNAGSSNNGNESEKNNTKYDDASESRKILYPDDPNYQSQKREFLNSEDGKDNYNKYSEQEAFSPYELKAGSIIPGILITGINSDLPGTILGIVREDVYDSVSGNNLLIPKGTKIKGTYDSGISYGQSRILVVWQRLIFSDGKTLNLDKFAGVDMSGYAGMTGKVNNHTYELFKAVVLSSVLGAGSSIIANNNNKDDNNWQNAAGVGAGEQVMTIGANVSNKALGIQPTIVISQGERFNIIVESDLILTPYKRR